MAVGNANFDTLATTTLVKYADKQLVDNIFQSNALFYLTVRVIKNLMVDDKLSNLSCMLVTLQPVPMTDTMS